MATLALPARAKLVFPGVAAIAAILGITLLLSIVSGFQAYDVPLATRWQFSPLGLLLGFDPAYWSLRSGSTFTGEVALRLDYWLIFLKTCLMEAPFYLLLLRRQGLRTGMATLFIANFLTHPAVFFIFPMLMTRYLASGLTSEAFAAATEMAYVAWIYNRDGRRSITRPMLAILAANLFSWQLGTFV